MPDALKFVLSLEDRFSPTTRESSKALKELQNELAASKSKLSAYQQQLTHAKQLGDIEGYRKYSKLVEDARKETFRLGDALASTKGEAPSLVSALGAISEGFGGVAVAGAAMEAGIAIAFAGIVAEGVKTAIEVNEVNERLTATFNALGSQGPESGKKTLAMLDDLARKLPQSRELLGDWTKEIEALGITDLSDVRSELRATASAQAIMGSEGVEAYEMLRRKVQAAIEAHQGLKIPVKSLQTLYQAGINITKVSAEMGVSTKQLATGLKVGTVDATKFGLALRTTLIEEGKEPLAAMGNELGVLRKKAGEALGHLFDGIDTSPISNAFKTFMYVIDQAQPSGQALKKGIGDGIQGVITWLGKMGTEATIVFLEIELFAVKNKHAIKDIENAFKLAGDAVLGIVHGMERLIDLSGKIDLRSYLDAALPGAGALLATLGAAGGRAPAHAEGGLVKRPAAGEFFASVAPGEMILPQREVRQLSAPAFGGRPAAFAATPTAGGGVRIERVELNIQAPHGVTDAQSISATGLALALERYQLGSGR